MFPIKSTQELKEEWKEELKELKELLLIDQDKEVEIDQDVW